MRKTNWQTIAANSLAGDIPEDAVLQELIAPTGDDLLDILAAAFRVRSKYFDRKVFIHILNNVQNGHCSEDCHYCAQSKSADTDISEYPLKSAEEILDEAKEAYESGAYRYCLVFAGRQPSLSRIQQLAAIVKDIKKHWPLSVCVSPGILNAQQAKILKNAGVDRINHNLNTSARHYPKICTTHSYQDRLQTIKVSRSAGLSLCSGIIIGMGENADDIIAVTKNLRKFAAESIPVNFYLPIPGTQIAAPKHLTPEYCLRVLCLFRFVNPTADIRVAAGREYYLRRMEVMALYAATSLFLDGYLNARGCSRTDTLSMIQDAGFVICGERSVKDLLEKETPAAENSLSTGGLELKKWDELHRQWPE